MATPVNIILLLTPEGAERYLSRKRIRDRSKRKHQAGISNQQVNIIRNTLIKHGFTSDEPEVVEVQPEWMHRGQDQINSRVLLELARGMAEDRLDMHTKILVVTDADIYDRASKSVMSLEDPDGGVVVVSTMRIGSGDQWRFLARLLKLIVHGLGHTLGLSHCRSKECMMYSFKLSTDLDIKSQEFCERCHKKVGSALTPE